jgi:DNA-binding CsgD family transcriptional regulator
MEDEASGMRLALGGVLLAIVVGGAIDLMLDAPTHWRSGHVLYELGLIAGGVAGTVWLWRNWKHATERAGSLQLALGERQAERDAWRARAAQALQGLARAVSEQFRAWELTPAEREIALLLLKGQSHKQIAAATDRSERIVRQHAVALYGKAGVSGRAELAAFFLGDLTLQPAAGDPSPVDTFRI